jgi:hypothetical protein
MGILQNRGREVGRRLKADPAEIQAQVLNLLDDLVILRIQVAGALDRGDTAALQSLAVRLVDRGHSLLALTS